MINKFKRKFSANKKNIAKISSGTLIGQGISILLLPFIARIYGPKIIGLWTFFNSIAIVIKSFSDLGMTYLIMIKDEKYLEDIYVVVTSIVFIVSFLSSSIVTTYLVIFEKNDILNTVFIFVFIMISSFITQQVQVCYTWLNRKCKYNVLMKNPIINTAIFTSMAILFGIVGFKTYGYFVAYIMGQLITLINMKKNLPNKFFSFSMIKYKDIIINNKKFIFFQMPNNILSGFKNQLPIILIQNLWGAEILGYYSITVRFLQIPCTLLANAIGKVFFQTISKLKRQKKSIGYYVFSNLIRSMKIGIIPMILVMAIGDYIVVFFLGEKWMMAGEFIRILTLQYYFMFLMNSMNGLEIILEKQNYAIISISTQILGYIVGAFVGKYILENVNYTLILMSIIVVSINLIYFVFLFKVMKISIIKYLKSIVFSIFSIIVISYVIRVFLKNLFQF